MSHIIFEKDFARHPTHYFTLLCVQVIGLWGLFWFNYHRGIQLSIVISMAAAYLVWGIIHHWQHKDLHIKVLFEYVLYAFLAVVIFGSLLLHT